MKRQLLIYAISLSSLLTSYAQIYTPNKTIEGSSGNNYVGIGTNTPYTSLSLGASLGDKIALWEASPTSKYGFGVKPQCMQIYTSAKSDRVSIGYYNNGNPTENLIVTEGKVGINTITPYTSLSLGASLGDKLALWEASPTSKYGFGVKSQCMQIYTSAKSDRVSIGYYNNGNPTENLIVTEGKVGINTITPYTSLSLGASLGDKIALWEASPTSKYGFGVKSQCMQIYTSAESDRVSIGYYNNGNPTENLTVKGGKVGIGTIEPTYTLDVIGTIRAQEIKVDLEGADFVFEEDYSLMPLDQLEKFVTENKHLPEINSAKEMEKNGTNLGDLNSKLLQKIEELTLYTIAQNKAIEELKEVVEIQNSKIEKLESTVK